MSGQSLRRRNSLLGRSRATGVTFVGLRELIFVAEMIALLLIAQKLIASEPVSFDLTPAVMAKPLPTGALPVMPGYEAVEVKLSISTLVNPSSHEPVTQLLYRITSHRGAASVLDYQPRTTMISPLDGPVEVTVSDEQTRQSGLNVTGLYPPAITKADLGAEMSQKNQQSAKFRRQANQASVVTSGTVERGAGVYFKLRPAYDRTLEGDKLFTLVLQLPINWQATILDVNMEAWSDAAFSRAPLATETLTVAVWREGNAEARESAMRLAQAVQGLRESAVHYDRAIRERSFPTVFHKLGAAMEVLPPKIPSNWMAQVLVANVDPYHDEAISQLPVDVRVAILEYQDARDQLLKLAAAQKHGGQQGGGLLAQSPPAPIE